MGIITTNITEDNFVKKDTPSYNLSVLIGADRFSYAITGGDNSLLMLKSFQFENGKTPASLHKSVQDVFIEDSTLSLPYNKVIVGLSNHVMTLVPDHLYDAENTQVYLEAQTDQLNNKTIRMNEMKSLGAKNIYAFDKEVLILIKGYLPNAHFFHASSAFIEGAIRTAPPEGTSKIYLNIYASLIQIVLMNGSKLIFSNSFSFLSAKDMLYLSLIHI